MAYTTPYTFIALSVLTAAQLNVMQENISALWPYTASGDISFANNATSLTRLPKGTQNYALTMGASLPEWKLAPGSMVLIEEEIVSGGTAADITLSSIPGTYRHLMLFGQIRSNFATLGDPLLARFNSDTGSNYDYVGITTSGYSDYTAGNAYINISAGASGATASASRVLTFRSFIPYYSKTTWYKTILSRSGNLPDTTNTHFKYYSTSNQWRSINAITAIKFYLNNGQIVENSIISLYGIL